MKRRNFIKAGSLLSTPFIIGGMPLSAFSKSRFTQMLNQDNDRVLVLIQLNGGNDGLNTVIPLDQHEFLSSLRSNLLIPENNVTKLTDHVGLHPSFSKMKQLYDESKMSIIQGVAYPDQNRSHFRSTDIWQTASSTNEYLSSGWIGRHMDTIHETYPESYPNSDFPDPIAVSIGFQLSETCQGMGSNFSIALSSEDSLQPIDLTGNGGYGDTCYGSQVTFVQDSIIKLNAYSSVVNTAFENGTNAVEYPQGNRFAEQLRLIAKLISGGSKTKIYVANLGGFDTHANQVSANNVLEGDHANLMATLSDGIASFQADLDSQGISERVVGMTYSEFGRRIKSNGSNGTDHGTAAPLIVFGSCVSGQIIGENPDLSGEITDGEGVAMQYDFRSVYASILMDWFGAEENTLRDILYADFQYLPLITSCNSTSTSESDELSLEMKVYPNPTSDILNLKFEAKEKENLIEVYDMLGHRLITKTSRMNGNSTISLDLGRIPSGNYLVRVQSGNTSSAKKFIKL